MDLTVTTFVTMDGVMQAPGGPQEDPRGGFTHGGWLVPHFDQDAGAQISAWFERALWSRRCGRSGRGRARAELQVHGSAGLVQTLLAAQLVDELRLIVFPVVIGSGKRLFGNGAVPGTWGLVSSSATSAGAIIATYRPAGPLTGGEVGIEDGAEVRTR